MKGLIHIYEGDGKGKTTAAIGLSIRCAGTGERVLFTQFLKNDESSEVKTFELIDNIEYVHCKTDYGFYTFMSEDTKEKAREEYNNLLISMIDKVQNDDYRMLVLDEVISADGFQLIDHNVLMNFLRNKPEQLEVVMTGRDPAEELVDLADYVSYVKKIKHPYDKGIGARIGIEK